MVSSKQCWSDVVTWITHYFAHNWVFSNVITRPKVNLKPDADKSYQYKECPVDDDCASASVALSM